MAPFTVATKSSLDSVCADGTRHYVGNIDPEWSYESIPHGGYIISLICNAAIASQYGASRRDIVQFSAHFLAAVELGSYELFLRRIREGSSFHHVDATFGQRDEIRVVVRFLFGSLPVPPQFGGIENPRSLSSSSPLARRIPLSLHPCNAKESPKPPGAKFAHRMQWAFDPAPLARNRKAFLAGQRNSHRHNVGGGSGGQLEWAAWFDFTDSETHLDPMMVAYFSDVFMRLPDLLALAEQRGTDEVGYSYTTLVINVEFRCRLPESIPRQYASESVGLYLSSRFMEDGMHDSSVEVWTSPGAIGKGTEPFGDWREDQVCLAVATQLAIAHPLGSKRRKQPRAFHDAQPRL